MPALIVDAEMSLQINPCESRDCTSFQLTDETGPYSSSNNGGYGAPNFETTDAIDARVIVTQPDGTQTTITVYPTFPDSTGNQIVTITAAQLGLTTLPDGIWTLQYQVDFNNINSQTVQKSVTKTVLFACSVSCCVHKLIAKVAETECGCDSVTLQNALLAHALLKALCSAGSCGSVSQVTNILSRLTKLCSIQNCGCN